MIKCLLTELGRAGRENIWPSVMAHGPRCARSVRHDLGPNIFPSGPPTQSISTYSLAVLDIGSNQRRQQAQTIILRGYYPYSQLRNIGCYPLRKCDTGEL